MPFTISPGVLSREIDLTTVVPTIATTRGGFAGPFLWGPIEDPLNSAVSSSSDLQKIFWKKNESTAVSYLSAQNFLLYGGTLEVSRIANTLATNATTANTTWGATVPGETVLIKNTKAYELGFDEASGGLVTSNYGPFVAKYAGERGNSLRISICGPTRPEVELTGTYSISGPSGAATSTDALVNEELRVGDVVTYDSGSGDATAVCINIAGGTPTFASNTSAGAVASVDNTTLTRLARSSFSQPSSHMIGHVSVARNNAVITGFMTKFTAQFEVGDIILIGSDSIRMTIASINSDTSMTASKKSTVDLSHQDFSREWEFASQCPADDPSTSDWAESIGAENDEIHIAIVNSDGKWGITGSESKAGDVLEFITNASVAINHDGGKYYKTLINNSSYCWFMNHPQNTGETVSDTTESSWGSEAGNGTKFPSSGMRQTWNFNGGADGTDISDGDLIRGFDRFKEPVDSDISVIFTGAASSAVCNHVISSIAGYRKDIMVFCSPELSDVLSETNQASNVIDFRNKLPSSSYASMDSGWKKVTDGSLTRYIPLNSDCAGLAVETEDAFGAFYSPAGFTRGQIRSVVDLVFNPSADDRDRMYKKGVNSVVRFPGQGTVLFGDKTLLAKPNAFDRINVRRLFISLEKSISRAAQQSLFEFNDDFTRSQFTSIVEPFLRDIQARGGITDFLVVCDDSNNTPSVIDNNQFVGSIYVKPARSINFIELNFVAVRTGVEFSEVVGQR
mgnify:FL=1